MPDVAIVDTSIFCNILDIPQRNENRDQVMRELKTYLESNTNLLLPMAVIYETGNHIANAKGENLDGNKRRTLAETFVQQVQMAITGKAPWRVLEVPTTQEIKDWLTEFPDSAMKGAGMADLSIIKEWYKLREKIPNQRVFIWSLDQHLQGYSSH
ncbi:hypothetical protein K4A83_10615 [Spirulina subsalsa FACHB-351]|uniref:PIN domain-containing protein n=1 Tax=Spirulina subsalsa FACHB-351 TaxID=234711 RepID=A0ABT3L5D1_9CYAN|nr:hypothetical protein [Spirulina subsalsa]MCW6036710.1 hypothetical protein [Spirulina subsalsa FACHB-351]